MYQLSHILPLISNSQQVISRYAVKNSDFCKGIDRRLSVAALILRNTSGRYAHQFCHNRSGHCASSWHSSNAVSFSFLLQSDVQIVYKITRPFYYLFCSIFFAPLFSWLLCSFYIFCFLVFRKRLLHIERNIAA